MNRYAVVLKKRVVVEVEASTTNQAIDVAMLDSVFDKLDGLWADAEVEFDGVSPLASRARA